MAPSRSYETERKDNKTYFSFKHPHKHNMVQTIYSETLVSHQSSRPRAGPLHWRFSTNVSSRGLYGIQQCQTPGKPVPDQSQILLRVDKVASRSANNRSKENAKRFPSAYLYDPIFFLQKRGERGNSLDSPFKQLDFLEGKFR